MTGELELWQRNPSRRLADLLDPYYGERVLPGLDVLIGGTNFLSPDVVVLSENAQFRFDMLASPAILCVEILSPGQIPGEMFSRCEKLHQAGHELCWVIWPKKRQAWIYRPEELIEEHNCLRAPLPDEQHLDIPLDKLFGDLPEGL